MRPLQVIPLPLPPSRPWVARTLALVPPPPAAVTGWLTEPGLLTDRLRAEYGDVELRIVDQRHDRLRADDLLALDARGDAGFVREIELWSAGQPRVFAQTLVPAATLAACPWLAQLGATALGETLAARGGVTRGPLEFVALRPGDELHARACHAGDGPLLWARRSWFGVDGRRFMVQEVFLPGGRP